MTTQDKKMQMEILRQILLFTDLGKKGMSGDPLSLAGRCKIMIEVPEQVKLMSRKRYGELSREVLGGFSERGGGAALCGGSCDECGITIEYVGKTGVRLLGEREFQYGNRTVGSSIFRYVKANSDVVKE